MEQVVDEGRTASETAIVRRPKPEFITVGEGRSQRQLCSTGMFNVSLGGEYVLANRARWISVGELARVFYGANTPTNKARIRRRMFELLNHLLVAQRAILLYEFDGRRISAVKAFDHKSEADRQAALPRIDRMAQRCQWTAQQYELIVSVLKAEEQLSNEATNKGDGDFLTA